MKKPAPAAVPGRAAAARGKASQPGNAPGRGKAAHARPAPKAKPKPVPAAVKKARHAAALKAAKTRAANAKKAKQHPRRQLAIGGGVACCSAQALAASLRLAGVPVGDDDVLALYWRTARDEDEGASVLATLEAAARFGLAGFRPQHVTECGVDEFGVQLGGAWPVQMAHLAQPVQVPECGWRLGRRDKPHSVPHLADEGARLPAEPVGDGLGLFGREHALILGISDPAPHAVLATPDGWWSWGELYEPWTDEIDEAWEVTWPGTR